MGNEHLNRERFEFVQGDEIKIEVTLKSTWKAKF
jgi:hypothetical protein